MTDLKCAYCGKAHETGSTYCEYCGGATTVPAAKTEDPSPLLANYGGSQEARCWSYNGLMVWRFYPDPWRYDTCTWQFWAGDQLLESITLSRDLLEKFVPEHQDSMSLVWELFEVAHGEAEVARLVDQNGQVKGALFEVRRIQNEREEYVHALTYHDFVDAYRKEITCPPISS